jgi:hypothetical protein
MSDATFSPEDLMKYGRTCWLFLTLLALSAPAALSQQPAPCDHPARRQLDFILGDWRVTDSTGMEIGRNAYTRILKGCGIRERWVDTEGATGESITAYDTASSQWHQLYVGDDGSFYRLTGAMSGRAAVLEGSTMSSRQPGQVVVQRWTWTPVDQRHLTQRGEVSSDGGKSWRTVFLGMYERVAAP